MPRERSNLALFFSLAWLIILAVQGACRPAVDLIDDTETTWPTESWEVEEPEVVGMDPDLVQGMLDEIDASGINLDGVVVIHQGMIVAERYYPVYSQHTLHESYSITKSVISALVGIALREGCIEDINDSVLDYFPGRDFENLDEWKQWITIKHLLTMSSGLLWDQNEMISHPDWVQYTLDQPVTHQPGTTWFYSNGGPHVLSALIATACETDTQEFADQHLFGPLGITEYRWGRSIEGYPKGGWGLALTPRDLAKIGYLYLRDGVWEGKQILPEGWVQESTKSYYQVPDPIESWDLYYGYLWWIHGDGPYAAHGTKGQYIYIIPEKDLVVVITGNIPDSEFVIPQQLIRVFLIPAVGDLQNDW